MCAAFDAPILRCFSFWRLPDPSQAVPAARDALSTAVARCRRAGVTLGLENEGACTVGTGWRPLTSLAAHRNWTASPSSGIPATPRLLAK